MLKEPYYILHFDAAACLFEIRVNDHPVLTMHLTGQASSGIPINYAISKSGKQHVNFRILPLTGKMFLGKEAHLNYHIKLFDSFEGFRLTDQYGGTATEPVKANSNVATRTGSSYFDATIPYSLKTLWESGQKISDIENLSGKLTSAYLRIADLIVNKRYDEFKQEMSNREQNMALSMYLTKDESESRMKGMIKDFNNGYNHLLFDKKSIPVISAFDKKVSLKSNLGEPALAFGNKEQREQIMLDIEFYLPRDSDTFSII